MKGLLFVVVIYAVTFAFCIVLKIIFEKYYSNKKGSEVSPPKIYYITKSRKPREKQNTIPIQATVVEKEDKVE